MYRSNKDLFLLFSSEEFQPKTLEMMMFAYMEFFGAFHNNKKKRLDPKQNANFK